jgi:hypothetical protein
MKHLTIEALARLVDERPRPEEAEHLAACETCSAELIALREQTEGLGALPEIMPPVGDWEVLQAQLRSEGLVRDRGLAAKLGLARTPAWMPAAAAIVLFLGGAGVGAGFATREGGASGPNAASGPQGVGVVAQVALEQPGTVEEAASAVRASEQRYVAAVSRYRQLLELQGGQDVTSDPISRYAALEHLVSVSQAAVRQAPGDPFLNGFLASALAERDAAARMVSASRDNWF